MCVNRTGDLKANYCTSLERCLLGSKILCSPPFFPSLNFLPTYPFILSLLSVFLPYLFSQSTALLSVPNLLASCLAFSLLLPPLLSFPLFPLPSLALCLISCLLSYFPSLSLLLFLLFPTSLFYISFFLSFLSFLPYFLLFSSFISFLSLIPYLLLLFSISLHPFLFPSSSCLFSVYFQMGFPLFPSLFPPLLQPQNSPSSCLPFTAPPPPPLFTVTVFFLLATFLPSHPPLELLER